MREIKFRAWDKTGKAMRDLISIPLPNTDGTENESRQMLYVQYTGLKDKNGKEIYEGDIVKIKTKEWSAEKDREVWKSEVVWIKCDSLTYCKAFFDLEAKNIWYNGHDYEDYSNDWGDNDNIEVIGNIYENPNLIKQ